MILKHRLYKKEEPSKDAKLIIIYCEGRKREDQYFNYFSEISSRIKLEVEPPEEGDDNSPLGLYDKAVSHIVEAEENSSLKYELVKSDEVWFVIDTDSWEDKIDTLRDNCASHHNWEVAQSNPCFEVWLYYHLFPYEEFEGMEISKNWKTFLDSKTTGGFDSRKHPVYIKDAITNSKSQFSKNKTVDKIGSTEVFKLAENMLPLIDDKIKKISHKI